MVGDLGLGVEEVPLHGELLLPAVERDERAARLRGADYDEFMAS